MEKILNACVERHEIPGIVAAVSRCGKPEMTIGATRSFASAP
jgi:hypothetical protein